MPPPQAPTTPVVLGEGFVHGLERTVTKVTGVFEPPAPGSYTASKTYWYTDCLLEGPPTSGTLKVEVAPKVGQIAVIVWE